MAQDVIVRIQGLNKTFRGRAGTVVALNGIDLDIYRGEIFGIIGFSGAGKSTLVRCINLLERPTSGTVTVDGQELTSLSERELRQARKKISMIFQSFNLLMQRTVLKNVCFPMELSGTPAAQARKRALELLDLVGLREKADAYPSQLSGGQKQRVAIARMLMQQAPVMIFDDSLSAVDAETDEKIRTALRRSTGNATVLLISHRVTTLMQADRILVLDGGRVAELGTHAQLVEKPGIYRDIYNIQMQSADRALLEEGGSEHGGH